MTTHAATQLVTPAIAQADAQSAAGERMEAAHAAAAWPPPVRTEALTTGPRNAAVPPAPTFADGMTTEDDRRFLELTNDLTHNVPSDRLAEDKGE